MGQLVNAGVPMLDTISITADISGNMLYRRMWRAVYAAVKQGKKISPRCIKSPLLPKAVVQMIAAGEESGKLGEVLDEVSEFYARELKAVIKGVTAMIEPLMIVADGRHGRLHRDVDHPPDLQAQPDHGEVRGEGQPQEKNAAGGVAGSIRSRPRLACVHTSGEGVRVALRFDTRETESDITAMALRTDIRQPCPARLQRRGFTLIEAALTTFIIGTAVLATVQLFATCTQQNSVAAQGTTAMFLASHVQETIAGLPVSDPSYANTYFGPSRAKRCGFTTTWTTSTARRSTPPIDATRTQIPQLSQYTQAVTVVPVLANKLNANTNPTALDLPKSTYTGAVRVQVRIMYQRTPASPTVEVYRTSWLRFRAASANPAPPGTAPCARSRISRLREPTMISAPAITGTTAAAA